MQSFAYWSKSLPEIEQSTNSSLAGLSSSEAHAILQRVRPNRILSKEHVTPLRLFLRQFTSPIVVILILATIVSAFLSDWVDAAIILLIVVGSALLSFYQEYNANRASEKLRAQVLSRTDVLRDGKPTSVATTEIVPGDVVLLAAGSLIPGDGVLPAIININLSRGSQEMAKRGVIVRRLESIENFGSMDILCTDKTGTLTQGVVQLDGAQVLTGSTLNNLGDEALWHAVEATTIFAEVDPNQKERIILALKKRGHVVGGARGICRAHQAAVQSQPAQPCDDDNGAGHPGDAVSSVFTSCRVAGVCTALAAVLAGHLCYCGAVLHGSGTD